MHAMKKNELKDLLHPDDAQCQGMTETSLRLPLTGFSVASASAKGQGPAPFQAACFNVLGWRQ